MRSLSFSAYIYIFIIWIGVGIFECKPQFVEEQNYRCMPKIKFGNCPGSSITSEDINKLIHMYIKGP